ncbi:hypothetical protein KA183_16470 [bacterium]|nr:hypothetical protein [bacterium]
MESKLNTAIVDVLIEILLLIIANLIGDQFGLLTFESTTYNESISKILMITFPLWGLLLLFQNTTWRRRTSWLSAILFLFSPPAGVLLFLSRLFCLSSFTLFAARWLGVGLLIIEILNSFGLMAFLFFGPAHIKESRVKVGSIYVNQYVEEYSLRTKPTLVLQKQIPLVGNVYMSSYIFEVPNQGEFISINIIDSKNIEIEIEGKPLKITVN